MDRARKSYQLTPLTPGDFDYLYSLCEVTMSGFVRELWGKWPEEAVVIELKRALAADEYQAILCCDVRVGALSVTKDNDLFRLNQIYIDPLYQRQGIGSSVVNDIVARADSENVAVSLTVLPPNPATRFYEHLGFTRIRTTAKEIYLEWHPSA